LKLELLAMRVVAGLRAFILAAILFLTLSAEAYANKRVALVIGNSTYQNVPQLPNPARDAASIAQMLRGAGFDVVDIQQNAGNLDFKRAIRRFDELARDSDVAVVYYAGHGIEIGGVNYMVPVDAKLASDLDASDEAITLDRIVEAVDSAKQLRLVILDACRDNPFVTTMKRQRTASLRGMSGGLGKVEPTSSGTLIAYAAKAGSTADDGLGEHSPFTVALLKHLTQPGLDIRLALGRVRDEVMKITNQRQEPYVYGSLGGATVALVSTPEPPAPQAVVAAPVAPTAPVDPNLAARRDYEYFERVGTKEAWDAFLKLYSAGLYADLARAQRAKLAAAESRQRVPEPVAAPSPAPQVVAAATPPPRSEPMPVPVGPAPGEIARLMQTELARVGCYSGAINGDWNTASRRAVDAFNKSASTKIDSKTASLEGVDKVRDKQARVCPLECDSGFKAEDNKCVKIACESGSALNDKGACEPVKSRENIRETTRSEPEKRRAAAPRQPNSNTKPSGAGSQPQYACDRFSCQPVKKGCTVRTTTSDGRGTEQVVICN
jgi:uncharacterized caspase-like protein